MQAPVATARRPAPSTLDGRHYRSGQPIRVHVNGRFIAAVETLEAADSNLPWIAPSLLDLQVNGFAGVDFQRDDLSLSRLESAACCLLAAGCGGFLLTLITDAWPRLIERLRRLKEWRDQSPLLGATVAGWHLEGPFLSEQPGFHGAHNPAHLLDPTPGLLAELRSVAGNDPLLLTLAPERPGALEAIRQARELGIQISLGHTNASVDQLQSALLAGARGFTHLGNACPQQLDRHDNILWRVLDLAHRRPPSHGTDCSPFCISLIPDGIHLPATLFRVLHRALPVDAIQYVTDAMAAADAPAGPHTLGSLTVQVGSDGVVRQPGQAGFAGSSLRPLDGVFRAARMLDQPWADCWDRFSVVPARWMGWDHGLAAGLPANLCLLEPDPACQPSGAQPAAAPWRIRTVLQGGEQLFQRFGDC